MNQPQQNKALQPTAYSPLVPRSLPAAAELGRYPAQMDAEASPFREVWLESPDGKSLCALINGDVGWLMYLRENGDAGFSSRNPDYLGPPDEMVEYRLSNGQHDLYPRAWAYPTPVIERALEYFRTHNQPPPFISWYNDSGDATAIGGAG